MKQKLPLICACSMLLGSGLAAADESAGPACPPELMATLVARIAQLERRVSELENGPRPRAGAVLATWSAHGAQAAPPTPEAHHAPPRQAPAEPEAQTPALPAAPSFKLSGFSDFNFSSTDQSGVRSGFTEGQFVLHAISALSPRVNVFSELSFSARTDAGTGMPAAAGYNAEVERIHIRFDQSDYFKVSFGRYHTPVNWWNTAFHHGQWLQTTVSRPEMTQFGGRFIPVHFVGALVEGAVPAAGLNLNYNVGLGNGRGSVISRGGDAGDNNNSRAWLMNLFVKPNRPFGLQTGGSVYRDRITLGARNFDEWITSGHIVWTKEDPEVIAEVANIRHTEPGRPGSFNSQAYYVQLGYRLPGRGQLWKPYYRFEYIHIPRTNPVFTGLPGLAGSVAGVRYDLTNFAAIKLEYRNQRRPGLPRINGGFLQTAFTF